MAPPALLEFTHNAAAKVAALIQEEGNPALKLRLYVTGGGCSGFQYGFAFDDQVAEDDTEIVTEGVALVVDAMSQQYLMGARVDYEDGLEGSRFVIHNPNAQTTCGCGSSFSV
ncbi:MAG: iron-sulfur cluster insertion protein ErpA [Aquabacterium sp.]|nr:MAG: iron-sulfur cluster insertion protein ErpA [Aquabacterium sp.]